VRARDQSLRRDLASVELAGWWPCVLRDQMTELLSLQANKELNGWSIRFPPLKTSTVESDNRAAQKWLGRTLGRCVCGGALAVTLLAGAPPEPEQIGRPVV